MRTYRQSTVVTIRIGPALDSAGAEYTGLVIGDLTLTKAGTSAAMAAAATLTHIANGHYSLVTIAGNTDTVGSLRIDCNKATYQIPPVEGEVVEEVVYDALFAASAPGYGTAQTGDSFAVVNSGTFGNSALKTLIDAVDNFVDTEVAAISTTLGTPSDLGGGATVAANLVVIEAQTDDIGTAGAGLTAVAWNAAWDAEVQSEVDDALIAKGLDHLVFASVTGTDIADDSIIAKLVSKSATADWDSYVNTTDALEALRDNTGTAGAGLTAADDAVITALATAQTDITAILVDTDSLDTTKLTTARAAVLTDWIDGGRLDLILDARASQASVDTIDDFLDTEVAAILAAVDTEIGAIQTTLSSLFTTALTESYRTDGATGTVAQLLYEINAQLGEVAISSTTKRLNKIDGTTQAAAFTLNSATTPTAITRAS